MRHTKFISQAVASFKVQTDKNKDKRLGALGEVERKFIKASRRGEMAHVYLKTRFFVRWMSVTSVAGQCKSI